MTRGTAVIAGLCALFLAACELEDPVVAGPCGLCSINATCDPAAGTCTCKEGYEGTGRTCLPIDPCATDNGGCDTNATCSSGGDAGTLCACNAGFEGDGLACTAVCDPVAVGCSRDATCTFDAQGDAVCACKPGFVGDGLTCTPTSGSCDPAANGCAANATCTYDASGTPVCACPAGYTGDGRTCTDIDECATGAAVCSPHATCVNEPGTYRCRCKPGYSGDGKSCTDTNECETNNGGCGGGATCENLPGSFQCGCAAGFAYQGGACIASNPSIYVDATFSVSLSIPGSAPRCRNVSEHWSWNVTDWKIDRVGNVYSGSLLSPSGQNPPNFDGFVELTITNETSGAYTLDAGLKFVFPNSCVGTLVYDLDTTAANLPQSKVSAVPLTVFGQQKTWYLDESVNLDQVTPTQSFSGSVSISYAP